jgi:hypothetical protein
MSKTTGNFAWSGIPGLNFKERRVSRAPELGWAFEYVYEGTPAAVNAAMALVSSDQVVHKYERDGLWELVVSTADDPTTAQSNVFTNTYELAGNSAQKDIREHPSVLRAGRVAVTHLNELLATPLGQVTDAAIKVMRDSATNGLGAFIEQVYRDIRARDGGLSFDVSIYIFRVQTVVSRRSTFQVAFGNINELYTFEQLIEETKPPAGYVISLTKIKELLEPRIVIPADYAWRWKKGTPTVSNYTANRLGIQVEFELGIWQTRYYALMEAA